LFNARILHLFPFEANVPAGFRIIDDTAPPPRYAFVGMRACELAAIAIQDRVFQGGAHVNTEYAARRAQTFLVAMNCGDPSATCFC